MKISTLLASLVVSFSLISIPATSNAQTYDGKQLDAALERMNVAPNQEEQVRTILIDGMAERLQILEKAGFERGKKPSLRQLLKVRDPIQKSRSRTEQALAKILDKSQIATYQQIVEENKAKLRARFGK